MEFYPSDKSLTNVWYFRPGWRRWGNVWRERNLPREWQSLMVFESFWKLLKVFESFWKFLKVFESLRRAKLTERMAKLDGALPKVDLGIQDHIIKRWFFSIDFVVGKTLQFQIAILWWIPWWGGEARGETGRECGSFLVLWLDTLDTQARIPRIAA